MSPIEELATPGRAAVLTMELQRGVVGDLASMRALADVVAAEGIPKRMAELLEGARRAEIPVIHCRAAFRRDRAGSYFNIPMVNRLLEKALVHESETCRRILGFGGLVQAPIAKDSGRPSSVIRFRMLQAITASASCDLG